MGWSGFGSACGRCGQGLTVRRTLPCRDGSVETCLERMGSSGARPRFLGIGEAGSGAFGLISGLWGLRGLWVPEQRMSMVGVWGAEPEPLSV